MISVLDRGMASRFLWPNFGRIGSIGITLKYAERILTLQTETLYKRRNNQDVSKEYIAKTSLPLISVGLVSGGMKLYARSEDGCAIGMAGGSFRYWGTRGTTAIKAQLTKWCEKARGIGWNHDRDKRMKECP